MPKPPDLDRARLHVELTQLRRRIWFLAGELQATVDLLDLEDSPALEDREHAINTELHAACQRRAVLCKALGLPPPGARKIQVIR